MPELKEMARTPHISRKREGKGCMMTKNQKANASRSPDSEDAPNRRVALFWPGAMLLALGYLLFCHGCHGDEDHELFARHEGHGAATP